MQYGDYKVEDFLIDEFFVRWVKKPGPETDHFWESWIEKNPEKIKTINEAREIIISIKHKNLYQPSKEEYTEVLENIMKSSISWSFLRDNKRRDTFSLMVKYTAVLLFILSFSSVIVYLNLESRKDVLVQSVEQIEKINPDGQKMTFNLDDGTKVKLNSGSKLTYQKVFDENERRVKLEGEAFFEVKRDESRPFIVETEDLVTTVLGTSFNIQSYKGEKKSMVAVSSGKVKVMKIQKVNTSENRYFLLNENQMITYSAVDNSIIKSEPVPEQVFSWKENIIDFDHSEFENIIGTLQRWYGVEFIINNGNSFDGRFKGKYDNEPLELVLEGIKGEYGFEYKIEGKIVYIN